VVGQRFRHYQIIGTALVAFASGSAAVYNTLTVDSVGKDGHRCLLLSETGGTPVSSYTSGADPFERIARGEMCDQLKVQAIYDLRIHPIASIAGCLFPTVIMIPAFYWLFGWSIRRYEKRRHRFKKCEFCAERIMSEAKVCRFCGRDVSQQQLPAARPI